jgi:hypothetical protein
VKGVAVVQDDQVEADWIGRDLLDREGGRIGKIEDVLRLGDATGGITLLVVEAGSPGSEKVLVPASEVRRAGDRLSVPYMRDRVKDAPKVKDELALTEHEKGKLCRYYGLLYVASPSEPSEGCEEMPDQRPGG